VLFNRPRGPNRGSEVKDSNGLQAHLASLFELGRHPLRFASAEQTIRMDRCEMQRQNFADAAGNPVSGWLCRPEGPGPHPAVLVVHAHGGRYDIGARELVEGRPALGAPLGPELARAGLVALCLDLPCFGARAARETESAAAKAALWRGGSLAGRMLGELQAQLDWLCADPRVDAARVGVFGLSMGATLGTWLAAVDPRVRALAQLVCFADMDALIATGAHDLHGIYLTVPGLLRIASTGAIAGLVAPRPQLVGIGDLDPLTPPAAADIALAELRAAYAAAGADAALRVIRDPAAGHEVTPAMRAATLELFVRALGQGAR